jgi:histone H3/H4
MAKKTERPCIPRSLFIRSVEVPKHPKPSRRWRIRRRAWVEIQRQTEKHIGDVFRMAYDVAQREGRKTVRADDFVQAAQ